MGDIACDSFCFSSLGFSLFLASVLGSCLRCVHRWSARSSSRVTFSASAVSVVLALGSCSVLLAYSMLCSGREFSSPRCHRRTALSVWQAAHCTVHRGQPPLHRHQPVSTLVEGFGLCCRGSRLIYQQVSLSPPGGTPERSAPFQKCGLALLSRLTILASMVVPSFSSCRVSPPRGVDQCLVRRKNPFQNFSHETLVLRRKRGIGGSGAVCGGFDDAFADVYCVRHRGSMYVSWRPIGEVH